MFYLIQYNNNNPVNVLSDTVIWEIIFYIKIIYLHELIRNRDIVLLVYERQLISMCIRSGCKSNFPDNFLSVVPPFTCGNQNICLFPAIVLFEQSYCIDWMTFCYIHWPKYNIYWYLIHVVRTVKNGNSNTMDMIEDTLKTVQTTLVSALFRKFGKYFGLFDIAEWTQ